MKYLSMVAAITLALSSTPAAAQTAGAPAGNPNQPPAPGPVAGHPLEGGAVPAAAIAVGAVALAGAMAVILLGTSDSNNQTNTPANPAN
jgi:hypothetical protein